MTQQPFPEGIDLVAYINLNIRTDRREEIEKEFERLGIPQSKILRWTATRHKRGDLGCAASHIALLEHIATLPDTVQTILVLEDDFNFIDDASLVKTSLKRFLEYPRTTWDLALLSYDVLKRENYDDLVSLTLEACRTDGYIFHRGSLPGLLANFKEGYEKHLQKSDMRFIIDIYWHNFMKNRRCFYFNQALGYQRKSYSNIRGDMELKMSRVLC